MNNNCYKLSQRFPRTFLALAHGTSYPGICPFAELHGYPSPGENPHSSHSAEAAISQNMLQAFVFFQCLPARFLIWMTSFRNMLNVMLSVKPARSCLSQAHLCLLFVSSEYPHIPLSHISHRTAVMGMGNCRACILNYFESPVLGAS